MGASKKNVSYGAWEGRCEYVDYKWLKKGLDKDFIARDCHAGGTANRAGVKLVVGMGLLSLMVMGSCIL